METWKTHDGSITESQFKSNNKISENDTEHVFIWGNIQTPGKEKSTEVKGWKEVKPNEDWREEGKVKDGRKR